jgi:hypothetical protein
MVVWGGVGVEMVWALVGVVRVLGKVVGAPLAV